jgi:hopanoid-associated phosphorylase
MTLGIICGYRSEQRIAQRITPLVAIGWRNPQAARELIAAGATTLLSFGVAGGLDPTLQSGALLLPDQVLVDGKYLSASPDLHRHLTQRFPMAHVEPIFSSTTVLSKAADKRALFSRTNAIAIDMESGAVAKAAIEAGLAFAIIRTISDPVDHSLPPAVKDALTETGDIDYRLVMGQLLKNPFQLPALIRTGRQNSTALRRLSEIVWDLRELLN